MGAATARALAREGRDVLLVEQFRLGHTRGSSHGRSRIFRLAYPEVEFVELAKESFVGWRELEQESDTELLELNGLLELVEDPAQSSWDARDGRSASPTVGPHSTNPRPALSARSSRTALSSTVRSLMVRGLAKGPVSSTLTKLTRRRWL